MARPRKEIDKKLLKDLAFIHLPDTYIAHCLNISRDTLRRRYATEIEQYKSQGKAKLLSKAWASVEKGEWPAIKFLLQNYLGLVDKIEQKVDQTITPITLNYSKEAVKNAAKD